MVINLCQQKSSTLLRLDQLWLASCTLPGHTAMLCLQPQVTWNSNRDLHSSATSAAGALPAPTRWFHTVLPSPGPALGRSGLTRDNTEGIPGGGGLGYTGDQPLGCVGGYFCRRLCGLESVPAWALLSALLHNSSLIGLLSLRKLGGWCKRKRVLGVSVLGGMSLVWVWKACGSVGAGWAVIHVYKLICLFTLGSKWETANINMGWPAPLPPIQAREAEVFLFFKRCYSVCTKIKWHF